MARTVNERSPLYMTITFTDENGDPLIPTSVEWRLDNGEDGSELVPWTGVSSAASVSVVIGATNHTIDDETSVREDRVFTIRIDNGLATEAHQEYKYHVVNLFAIPA